MHDWEGVWCCLNPREQAVAGYTVVEFAVSFGGPFASAGWDGLWDTFGDVSHAYRNAFIAAWGLERTIVVVDDVPVPAIGCLAVSEWGAFGVWLIASGGVCPSGCTAHPFL